MPSPKHPCPDCGQLTRAAKCRPCTGPYERTPEHRETMTKALLGKRHNYRSGNSVPEGAAKAREWWTPERREQRRQEVQERNRDPKYRLRYGRPGMLNPNYLNGQSVVPYEKGWTRAVKRQVLERDGHRCVDCGKGESLHIHHKDFRKVNHSPANLVTVCHQCHFARHAAHRRQALQQ